MVLALILVLYKPKSEISVNIPEIELGYSYELDRDSIDQYPLDEVMAAVAYHECFNLSKLERWLVMEAFHNRIIYNFNNNGTTVKEQLLAPEQFTGLWKYNPEQFKFDTHDSISVQNREMAKSIIEGNRICSRRIYYWAGKCDRNTSHGRFVSRDKLDVNTIHWFR